jgi:hypothetical protein
MEICLICSGYAWNTLCWTSKIVINTVNVGIISNTYYRLRARFYNWNLFLNVSSICGRLLWAGRPITRLNLLMQKTEEQILYSAHLFWVKIFRLPEAFHHSRVFLYQPDSTRCTDWNHLTVPEVVEARHSIHVTCLHFTEQKIQAVPARLHCRHRARAEGKVPSGKVQNRGLLRQP